MRTISTILIACTVLLHTTCADDGPYDYQRYFRALSCPIQGPSTAYVTITLPVASHGANTRFPTVVLLNGFVLRSCVYAPYANALAAHGYAVIQFDDAHNPRSDFSEVSNDVVRMQWIDQVLACTKAAAVFSDHFDWGSLALVGHSRGAKLAGLYVAAHATRPDVRTAYLIDPVDAPINASDRCIRFYPVANESSFPNLAHALKHMTAPIAMAGANITSKCNCNTSNYQELWPVAANGSWLAVLHEAGHLQLADDSLEFCNQESVITRWILRAVFTDPSKVPLIGRYLKDWTCTSGKLGTGEAIDLATRPMLAWLGLHVKGAPPSAEFVAWVTAREDDGSLSFAIRGNNDDERDDERDDDTHGVALV